MKLRHAFGVLAASSVLLVGGAALSDAPTTTVDQLMDFDRSSGELWAYPQGLPLATYLHRPSTVHLISDLTPFLPPDPCLPLARAWNLTVRFDAIRHVNSTFVFDILLSAMSDFRCYAAVTTTGGGDTSPPMISVGPVAQ